MKKYNLYLYDNLNRQYERKNLYLYDTSVLQEKIKDTKGNEKENLKNKLKELEKNKSQHPYIKKLSAYEEKEKKFLGELNNKVKSFDEKVDKSLPNNLKKLESRLFIAKEKVDFYKEFIDLTYDAELIYEQSKMETEQIPSVLKFGKECKRDLEEALKKKGTISSDKKSKFKEEFNKFKKEEANKLKKAIAEVKVKRKDGVISSQAKDNAIKELKRKSKEALLMKSFEDEKTYNDEIIKNKTYELKKTVNQMINTVDININELRRAYPIETEKTVPWVSYASLLVPGIGQLCNKQYIKSIIMFLATIYIYLGAIPYALGFGNYQGDGLAGLITLAEGGKRLDRSIIFMIEGIVALALIVIAVVLLILSFKDVNKVEKDVIKGIRVKSWCETRQTFLEDGFPYIVSVPALVMTIFIVLIPIATTILLSFTNMDPNNQAKFGWAALDNYKMIFLGEGLVGSIFWKILGWTIIWTLGATTLAVALGFILAIVLNNDRIKGKVLFRSIYLLPWAVPAFITILFFSILSSPNGALTEMLQGIFGPDFSIKNDATVVKCTLICIQAWLGSAYVFLLSTGVLQSINSELYEAADIDGATNFKKLAKITVPLVLFQTGPMLVGQYTFNFNNFSIIYLFNGGGPFNPVEYGNLAGETDLLISYIYKLTMENQFQALGAAISIIISIALMIIAYIGFKNTAAFRKEM